MNFVFHRGPITFLSVIVAVLRVLSDFLIWVIVCELFRSKFLTIWLRRCLWFSSSPTVYGNGSDFVSADTLRFCTFVRTIFLQRGPVWSSFSRQGLFFILASACCFGGSQIFAGQLIPGPPYRHVFFNRFNCFSLHPSPISGGACEQIAASRYCRVVLSIYEECSVLRLRNRLQTPIANHPRLRKSESAIVDCDCDCEARPSEKRDRQTVDCGSYPIANAIANRLRFDVVVPWYYIRRCALVSWYRIGVGIIVLYCAVLYCTVLNYSVLYYRLS